MNRKLLILICTGTTVFGLLLAGALVVLLGKQSHAALDGSAKFAAALTGTAPWTPASARVTAQYGPITSAEVLGAHNTSVGHGDDSRTYYVSDLLIRGAHGPAVLELSFDDHALFGGSDVTSVRELDPSSVGGLTDRERRELAAAYAARGRVAS